MNKALICVIDGCAPEYLTHKTAPNLFKIANQCGFKKNIQGAVPTVTNVNHACILTGTPPKDTGIVGNYFYKRETGEEGFIEEKGFLKEKTIIEKIHEDNKKTVMLAVKHKVISVYGDKATFTISAEKPDSTVLKQFRLCDPPSINADECTEWIMNSTFESIRQESPDFVYCTTNDYIFHHYAPGTKKAIEQIGYIDKYISMVHHIEPERQVYILADHGMNQKHKLIDFKKTAARNGIELYALPALKDRYIGNHPYQEGGVLYLFLKDKRQSDKLIELVKRCEEIEHILTADEAAKKYQLPVDNIGDFVLFASQDCAFAEMDMERINTNNSRTHGSLYEREIPFMVLNPPVTEDRYSYCWDIIKNLGGTGC